jgi:GNAT superfamily N-acetyltransferase
MLASRVDTNLFEFYEYAASSSGKPRVEGGGFSHVDLGPSPWAKAVYDLDFPEGALPTGLLEGIQAGRIPNKVRVGPSSRPRDVERLLAEAGFAPGKPLRGMTLELARRARFGPPAGLVLSPVAGGEEFAASAGIIVANLFDAKAETGPAFARVLGSLGRDRAFGIIGRAGGAAASAAFGFIDGEGVAGVYFVATEAGMRGRGYGAATVSAVLDELAARGAEECILQATEPGVPAPRLRGRLSPRQLCPPSLRRAFSRVASGIARCSIPRPPSRWRASARAGPRAGRYPSPSGRSRAR